MAKRAKKIFDEIFFKLVQAVLISPIKIFQTITEWRLQDKPAALVTVISTWGSAPRPLGSHLAVNHDLEFVGSVSGGCIENAVIEEALQVLDSGTPRTLEYGVSNEMAWEVGLACGGRIQLYVEPVKDEILTRLLTEQTAKRPVALLTRLYNGAQCIFASSDSVEGAHHFSAAELAIARETIAVHHSGLLHDGDLFLRIYDPPLRLIIVGAVHIAQALIPMAQQTDFDVTVVDPRQHWLSSTRFPNITRKTSWPDQVLQQLDLDQYTAIVILSHDPKLDDPALAVALRSSVFYIGALGSRRTHAARLQRLHELGFSETETTRIHAPIGLNIGAQSPAEIAVAILAEIIQALHVN